LTGCLGFSRLVFKLALTLGSLREMLANRRTGILIQLLASDPIWFGIWSMQELLIHFVPIGAFQPCPSPVPFLAPGLVALPRLVHPISFQRDLLRFLWRPTQLSHPAIIAPRIKPDSIDTGCRRRPA
jgi:hypothetical protein